MVYNFWAQNLNNTDKDFLYIQEKESNDIEEENDDKIRQEIVFNASEIIIKGKLFLNKDNLKIYIYNPLTWKRTKILLKIKTPEKDVANRFSETVFYINIENNFNLLDDIENMINSIEKFIHTAKRTFPQELKTETKTELKKSIESLNQNISKKKIVIFSIIGIIGFTLWRLYI